MTQPPDMPGGPVGAATFRSDRPWLPIEQVPGDADFCALRCVAGISIDLRYASPRNFTGRDLYSPHDCAWLHVHAAAALAQAAAWLALRRPDLRLLVLDALRPQRVQQALWQALDGTGLHLYLAEPGRGSIHSFDMAVDVTLAQHAHGMELDMGTAFDDMTALSHPALEAQHTADGSLSAAALAHRLLLRQAMQHAGFQGISTEWWHFDLGERTQVRRQFRRVA